MTDDRTCEETNDDPLLPRESWRPIVWDFFFRMAESYPEKANNVREGTHKRPPEDGLAPARQSERRTNDAGSGKA